MAKITIPVGSYNLYTEFLPLLGDTIQTFNTYRGEFLAYWKSLFTFTLIKKGNTLYVSIPVAVSGTDYDSSSIIPEWSDTWVTPGGVELSGALLTEWQAHLTRAGASESAPLTYNVFDQTFSSAGSPSDLIKRYQVERQEFAKDYGYVPERAQKVTYERPEEPDTPEES